MTTACQQVKLLIVAKRYQDISPDKYILLINNPYKHHGTKSNHRKH